MIAEV